MQESFVPVKKYQYRMYGETSWYRSTYVKTPSSERGVERRRRGSLRLRYFVLLSRGWRMEAGHASVCVYSAEGRVV